MRQPKGEGCPLVRGFDFDVTAYRYDSADDGDADGVPDGCDVCPGFDDTLDADGDGHSDLVVSAAGQRCCNCGITSWRRKLRSNSVSKLLGSSIQRSCSAAA